MNALLSLTLKGSAIGALLLAVTAVGCSDTKDDGDGTAGKGGTSAGGTSSEAGETSTDKGGEKNTTPEGGSDTGGTTGAGGDKAGVGGDGNAIGGDSTGAGGERLTGGGGEPASGGAPTLEFGEGGSGGEGVFVGTGPAEGKFCNTLTFGGDDTTFILVVGTGTSKATFTAKSRKCVPADGLACTTLPEGTDIKITLADADDPTTILDTSFADIATGEDWVFWSAVDNGDPITKGFPIDQSEVECKDVTYDQIP